MEFKVGDFVHWNDPGINDYGLVERDELLGREFEVVSVNGDIILITDGFSEAEVYEEELEPITSKH